MKCTVGKVRALSQWLQALASKFFALLFIFLISSTMVSIFDDESVTLLFNTLMLACYCSSRKVKKGWSTE